jgi:amino acid adenylation domain-containing protein
VPFFPEREAQSLLRLVFLSGDWIPVPLPDRIRTAFPLAHVVSLGGATEATIWSNWYDIGQVDLRWPSIPYGKPIRNARYYVLDERLEPLPIGAPGQLHIGGYCLADGYHQRPELNAEKFIDSPFLPGTKLYRTGDLARFMPDGNLEFLGRLDLQVKVRGYRIELGEIEAVINQHPAVYTSLLDAPRSSGTERSLVAYVVPKDAPPDLNELKTLCQQKLPDYMVPMHFMVLDALPVTPNGKVDRKALPAPTSQASAAYVAPESELETHLCEIFQTCLNVPKVGVEDSFFELGGHSLLAVRVISEIAQKLQAEIALSKFMQSPKVAAAARLVKAARAAHSNGAAKGPVALKTRPLERPALSFAQERLVFIQRLDPQSAAYNISLGFKLKGEVDGAIMRRALERVLARHEPLRTAFDDVGGVQHARITDAVLPFVEEDLRAAGLADRDLALAQVLRGQSGKPFELSRAPLIRAVLARLGEREYVLSVVVHHVVFDGASTGVLLEELLKLYDAFKAGKSDPLPPLPVRFNDFAVSQRESVSNDDWEDDIDYWQERLVHPLPLLQLPLDHPRPRTLSYRGAVLPWKLSRETSAALHQLARGHDATAFNVVLSGFMALLHHYSGQNDIVVGTPVSAREHAELRGLIGLFLNTVVIRLNVEGGQSFAKLVRQARDRTVEALEHRGLPFERLVEEINPPRDTSTTPLFQAFFGYEETSGRARKSEHFELAPLVLDQGFSRTDISLFVEDSREQGISGFFEYSSDLFDRDTIAEMALGLTALLEHAIEDADTHVAALRVMSPMERARQLVTCNQTNAPFDFDITTVQRFELEAEERKELLAICYQGDELSYGELLREVRIMATRLRAAGAGPGKGVALFLERSPRLVIAMLATHRIGSHYIPLDPTHPPERNGRVFRLAQPAVIVTETYARQTMPDPGSAFVLDLDEAEPVAEDTAPIAARPDGLAYIIFTSGSTGDPKGVEIEQRALTNFLCSMALRPGLGPSDHVVAITTISFDIAELELLLPMVTGASVEIVDRTTALDPESLAVRIADRPATLFQATPATYRMLIEAGWMGQPRLKALCGGEPLPRDLAEQLAPRVGSLWNMYGPTETTVWSSLDEVQVAEPVISIGRPIHNTQLYVLNEALEPVPRGATGMLWIAGDGVARGYHGRPDLTEAAFMRDPHGKHDSARMYRTGDLARRLRDGRLECLGRNDFQVKIRGYRIELGEIEAAIASFEGVRQAVVDVDKGAGEPRLVAFVVLDSPEVSTDALIDHVRTKLPPYMVPSLTVPLEAMPLTANGKVDRKALRAGNAAEAPMVRADHVGPRDDLELRVAAIFEQLLGITNPSVQDSFFDLGGHSLVAVRLTRELSTAFGIDLSIGVIFERPTIAALADAIREGGGSAQAAVLPLNRGKNGVPLYFICGIHVYRQLARALGEHQPCYGIFLPEEQRFFSTDAESTATVEELARMYVESMRRHTPEGPYMLAGVSFGGLLAFEMARQLTQQGDEVPLLVLIDAILPSAIKRDARGWLRNQVDELRRGGLRGFAQRAERKLRERFGEPPAEAGENELDRLRRAAYGSASLLYEQTTKTYEGTTILIKASENGLSGVTVSDDLGWTPKITGNLRIYQSVGDHLGVLREGLTAEIMQRELVNLTASRPSLFSGEIDLAAASE